ncbi:helix-turn-helix transcriptional regulator [Actinomadura rudentiformis]|uniref:Helix-turn-helix transcriptional regulator n=2 Tax=Actinomadura rudentiformis TaxID=359158 RepID=A0A6H9Z3V8_9ACTN|nr:helix-turn-helix transcriptional regulator [Actinomadura rudentiformis]
MRTLPTRHTVIIVNLGPPLHLHVPDPAAPPAVYDSFIAGMHDGHGMYEHEGGQRGIQLDVTPLGAYTLLGVPMGHLTNLAVDLADVLGPEVPALVDRLQEAPSWGDRFDLLDAFLLKRLEVGPSPDAEVREAWRLLAATDGQTPVAVLAGEVGWSRKHLTHRFKEQVGLSPKVMARVLRFQRAVELMSRGVPNWVDIAVTCGYYDQAHLNREFRALAGCTPTELLAARAPEYLTTTAREAP